MNRWLYTLSHPYCLIAAILGRIGGHLPDDIYLCVRYRLLFGYKLNLENPQTFNEKLNWLKIYNRQKQHVELVDKWEVKNT